MPIPAPVTFTLDSDRIGWIVFDAPGANANVFNAETQQAFVAALDAAESSEARALVITGAKDRIFIAGADLHWIQSLPDVAAADEFSRRGQALFQRVADSRVPVVCAIHGACVGGGFELALACDWRIASDAAVTQIGLPEVSIGTIPGWGGCARLPRLVGVDRALEHIVRGQLRPAQEALEDGLVDELVPSAHLKSRAIAAALRLVETGRPARPSPPAFDLAQVLALRKATILKTRGQQPAPIAVIDLIQHAHALRPSDAMVAEARVFGTITAGKVCKNLIRVFFLRDAAKKRTLRDWFDAVPKSVMPIRQVGVVGAGVMGSGIAHWLATRGFDVVLRDVRLEFVERALDVIRGLLAEGVKRRYTTAEEADIVLGRIRTTTDWNGFADCDLVVEAIVEEVAAKQELFSQLAKIVRPDAVLASNTSALPIDEIAGHVPQPNRVVGIHFFNPVSRMPLVELVIGQSTAAPAAARALELVRTLGKSPIICRSSPGFVVTRVLFFYLNAAVQMWEEGVDTSVIDNAMREFGWPMGPLRLIDEVGVDVTAFIFGEMARYFPQRFTSSNVCDRMLAAGMKGRKNGAGRGFYRYSAKDEMVNDAETREVGPAVERWGAARTADDISSTLMAVMVQEARQCLAERVVLTADDVDFALLAGAGFPAFRGGLLSWAEQNGV